MRLNEFIGSTGYEILNCFDYEGFDTLNRLNGKPMAKKWTPLPVYRARRSRREGCRPSDSPHRSNNALIFRRTAVDALQDILDAHGELLPLKDQEGVELYAYNPRALDALDQVLSEGNRDEDGILEGVLRHVFVPSVVEGVDIFRQARKRNAWIFVSDRFVQRWKQAKLKGLDFRLVWDSDLPPDAQPGPWKPKT